MHCGIPEFSIVLLPLKPTDARMQVLGVTRQARHWLALRPCSLIVRIVGGILSYNRNQEPPRIVLISTPKL